MNKPELIKDLGMQLAHPMGTRLYRYGLFECPFCHKEFRCNVRNVKKGQQVSCGCYRDNNTRERSKNNKYTFKHGMSNTKIYEVWGHMVQRCYSKTCDEYKWYGGRGIIVCDEWKNDPMKFIDWAFKNGYEESGKGSVNKYEIDRKNNDGNYTPDNCRFVTKIENLKNKRTIINSNKSGFRGVHEADGKWNTQIPTLPNGKNRISKGGFKTAKEAAIFRNNYIIEHNLPLQLNIIE